MNKWLEHVKSVFNKGKKKDAKYTYTQALKDAKKTYKKDPGQAEKNKKRSQAFFSSKKAKK